MRQSWPGKLDSFFLLGFSGSRGWHILTNSSQAALGLEENYLLTFSGNTCAKNSKPRVNLVLFMEEDQEMKSFLFLLLNSLIIFHIYIYYSCNYLILSKDSRKSLFISVEHFSGRNPQAPRRTRPLTDWTPTRGQALPEMLATSRCATHLSHRTYI